MPLTASASFQTIVAERTYSPTLATNVSARGPAVTIDYDAATQSYTLTSGSTVSTFAPADRFSGTYIDDYRTGSDELQLYNNVRSGASQAGAQVQLSYLSFAVWKHADTPGGRVGVRYLLFGYPTASANMPRSGSATYDTMLAGTYLDVYSGGSADFTGSATFSADFASGTVATQFMLNDISGGKADTFSGSGTIVANEFSGNLTGNLADWVDDGSFAGGFFGPSAAEMGYAFRIHHRAADPYAGASLLGVDYQIVGAAVGKKQ